MSHQTTYELSDIPFSRNVNRLMQTTHRAEPTPLQSAATTSLPAQEPLSMHVRPPQAVHRHIPWTAWADFCARRIFLGLRGRIFALAEYSMDCVRRNFHVDLLTPRALAQREPRPRATRCLRQPCSRPSTTATPRATLQRSISP